MNDREYYAQQCKGPSVKFSEGKNIAINEDAARAIIAEMERRFPNILKDIKEDAYEAGYGDASNDAHYDREALE